MQAPCVGFVLFRIDENLFQLFWFLHNPPNKDTFQSNFLFKVILTQPCFPSDLWRRTPVKFGKMAGGQRALIAPCFFSLSLFMSFSIAYIGPCAYVMNIFFDHISVE